MRSRFRLPLAIPLFLGLLGCKDPLEDGGVTSGVALYAFDATSRKVLVWKDLNALYDSAASTTPASAPSHQISSSLFTQVSNLAWGGLCLDGQRGNLYLVSDTGNIVRVSRIRSQTGSVAPVDVVSFSLASGDRFTNGKFGQASLDAPNDQLYITETGDNGTRVWVVAGASGQGQDASVTLQGIQTSGDKGGTGIAAASGSVYGFMADGSPVGLDALTGPRLRKGTSSAWDSNQVILGGQTLLGIHGSLALDTANGHLFVTRHNLDAGSTAPSVQVFRTGQFGIHDQPAAFKLETSVDQKDIRVISHPGNKDWLVGLRGQGSTGFDVIFLWKAPLGGTAARSITVAPAGSDLRGLAMDGNAS